MFPSILNTFTYPNPTDRLNSPSHSSIHTQIASIIGQVQTVIGTSTTSALGTIIGDIRNPSSDGGGHIQTAVKGGTGQTTFIKGDLLVATNASTLSKLATGLDGQVLVINSSTASGVQWSPAPGKIFASGSTIGLLQANETSIFSITIPGSTLGTNNAVKSVSYIKTDTSYQGSILTRAFLGGNMVASILSTPPTITGSTLGEINLTIIGSGATNTQRVIMQTTFGRQNTQTSIYTNFIHGTSSINSSANQTLGITWITSADQGTPQVIGNIIQKIT